MSLHLDPAILPVGCFDNDIDLFESQYAEIGRASCRERVSKSV